MRGVVSRYSDELSGLPEHPTPVDIKVVPPDTALLVTGPNTGGKTVALKTAGLLALMAQAGLHIPAEPGSSLPIFQSIFADIGDQQSIASSLSTFGWHIRNVASMDRDLHLPALVLLDEIGAGTDPLEGGALGVAIVDNFRRRGAIVVGTTHYDALKTYAATTAGVANAAFAFDPVNFAPTYRLVYGSPGRSLALEMATRLGLAGSIVEQARENLGTREAQLASQLNLVDEQLSALHTQQRAVATERRAAEEARARVEQRERELREREAAFKRKLNDRIDERVRSATREIDTVVQALKRQTSALATARHRPAATVDGRSRLVEGPRPRSRRGRRGARPGAWRPKPGARSPDPSPKPAARIRSPPAHRRQSDRPPVRSRGRRQGDCRRPGGRGRQRQAPARAGEGVDGCRRTGERHDAGDRARERRTGGARGIAVRSQRDRVHC